METSCWINFSLEKWKQAVDSGQIFGALLRDLFNAFDCLGHELLITKLNAYDFSLPALKVVGKHHYGQASSEQADV